MDPSYSLVILKCVSIQTDRQTDKLIERNRETYRDKETESDRDKERERER